MCLMISRILRSFFKTQERLIEVNLDSKDQDVSVTEYVQHECLDQMSRHIIKIADVVF